MNITKQDDDFIRLEGKIVDFNVPTRNGRVFSEDCKVKMAKDAYVYDQLGERSDDIEPAQLMSKAIGWVTDLKHQTTGVSAEITIGRNMPGTQHVLGLLEAGYTFQPHGTTSGPDADGKYRNVHITGYSLVPPTISSRPLRNE